MRINTRFLPVMPISMSQGTTKNGTASARNQLKLCCLVCMRCSSHAGPILHLMCSWGEDGPMRMRG